MKKLFDVKINEKGFVLIEFVIALPLVIMLMYALGQSSLTILDAAENQAADYILEVEAQEALTRITQDLKAASIVRREKRFSGMPIDTLIINYHTITNKYQDKYDNVKIIDLIDTRVYKVSDKYKLNAKRQNDDYYFNPITGDNSFGGTVITTLKYTKLDDNVIHITLEMESLATRRRYKTSTAVYMPACKQMAGTWQNE